MLLILLLIAAVVVAFETYDWYRRRIDKRITVESVPDRGSDAPEPMAGEARRTDTNGALKAERGANGLP